MDFEPRSLFFFAHQDDELGALPCIADEISRGVRPVCFFLTSGATNTTTTGRERAGLRNEESREVLLGEGCRNEDIHFLGSEISIDDGSLYLHLDEAYEATMRAASKIPEASVQNIYCPAWEGGHHDHDAAQLVALSCAARLGAIPRTYQFPLYNGKNLPGALFRPQSPIPENGSSIVSPLPRFRAIGYWLLARHYRSQWRTWMGLLLPTLLKTAWSPGISLQAVSVERILQRPHPGALFYERRYGVSYERFACTVLPFIRSRIMSESPASA
jgi:LmbE family N-acetylglucosaminyl deacetylase